MNRLQVICLVAVALGFIQVNRAAGATPQQCTRQWDQLARQHQTTGMSYQQYVKGCLSIIKTPMSPTIDAPENAPAGATARCRDGTYAQADSATACLHNRGVAAIIR